MDKIIKFFTFKLLKYLVLDVTIPSRAVILASLHNSIGIFKVKHKKIFVLNLQICYNEKKRI
jgi:hypothetical protein